jgi:hypothetical protein
LKGEEHNSTWLSFLSRNGFFFCSTYCCSNISLFFFETLRQHSDLAFLQIGVGEFMEKINKSRMPVSLKDKNTLAFGNPVSGAGLLKLYRHEAALCAGRGMLFWVDH